MRFRRVLIALFTLGTLGGYGSAIATSSCHARERRAAWERHVAQICADAARRPPPPGAASRDDGDNPW